MTLAQVEQENTDWLPAVIWQQTNNKEGIFEQNGKNKCCNVSKKMNCCGKFICTSRSRLEILRQCLSNTF